MYGLLQLINEAVMSELIYKSYAEQRENSLKFVYFLFSTTIVTLGFCMTLTKGITPTWWTLSWAISVLLLFVSLYFGFLYIKKNHELLGYLGIQYTINQMSENLFKAQGDVIKKDILEIKSRNISPTSVLQTNELVVIELAKNKSDVDFYKFIMDSDEIKLKNEILDISIKILSAAQSMSVNNNEDLLQKVLLLNKKAISYFNWQIKLLAFGYILLFFWNVSTFVFP